MADLFVSYARADRPRVSPLVSALEAEGWSVWWDPEIAPGQEFDRLIAEELEKARAVIVVWTPISVISRWVRGEAREAADRGVLAPVRFDNAHLPIDLRAIHTTDLDSWGDNAQGPAFRELVRALRTLLREPGAAPASAAQPTRLSICVLPFANLSGDPEQEYFSDGISEDIITDLSQISALHVVARNTAFTYKGKSVAIGQIARQLGVTHMLEGSVRKAGNRVRITAQLIDGASEGHVWAKRWDRDLDDIFALQDEISEAIVDALRLKLLPEERQAIENRGTANAEAYNHYLMARRYYVSSSMKRRQLAVRLGQRAVALDPAYARAWAMIAVCQAAIANNDTTGADSARAAAWAAADRALELDPGLADAHAAKGRLLINEGRLDEAGNEVDAALALDPASHFVNYTAGTLAMAMRRFADGVRYNEAAMAADEHDVASGAFLVQCLREGGDREAVLAAARETVARVEKAIAAEPDTGAPLPYGVTPLYILGETERAKAWTEHALLLDPDDVLMRYNLACCTAQGGDADYALDLLEESLIGGGRGNFLWAKTDSDLDPLRDLPRFQAIMAKMAANFEGAPADQGSEKANA